MKAATVALVVSVVNGAQEAPKLVDTISDDKEIIILEDALRRGEPDPLDLIYRERTRMGREEDQFGDYVEDLLSQPFLRPEIQEHGVQWLKSKLRIEEYQKSEAEAAKIISDYAFKMYLENRERTDFLLAGPTTQVRVRIFEVKAAPVTRVA